MKEAGFSAWGLSALWKDVNMCPNRNTKIFWKYRAIWSKIVIEDDIDLVEANEPIYPL